ncbi:hypothetical protein N8E89_23875 (plasmid) [Phyllobacterium sp. A18/5-2]|nr:hypothetical protein [Phyllobacterium sp. A18/5-2]UXN66227.1 hypothetical protein N8E89_23875 [Phyllobacterium sp. A18/5-2]
MEFDAVPPNDVTTMNLQIRDHGTMFPDGISFARSVAGASVFPGDHHG